MSHTHTGTDEGVTYAYRVRAHNAAGNGAWSEAVTAMRLNRPQVPTDIRAAASGVDIIVRWEAPASGLTSSYDVRYGETDSAETSTVNVAGGSTTHTHQSPKGDTSYTYHVRSVNEAGRSEWAGPTQAMRVMPPHAPTGLKTAISGEDITVSWTAPATGIIDRYELEYLPPNTQEWVRHNVDSGAASWTHAGPTPGTEYQYRARSVNAASVSDWTSTVRRTWFQGAAPPANLRITIANTEYAVLQWNRSTDPDVTSYELRTSVNGDAPTTQSNGASTFKIDYHSDSDVYREYAVRAVTQETPGDWTSTVRASLTQPTHPAGMSANIEGREAARIHWDHPGTGEPYQYIVESKKVDESEYPSGNRQIVYGFIRTTLMQAMEPEASYTVRIRAQSHSGEISPAEGAPEVTVTVPATESVWENRPSGLRVRMIDRTTFRLSWTEQETQKSNITGYRIYRKETNAAGSIVNNFDYVLVSNTGNNNTFFTDHTGTPGVTYEYALAVRWDDDESPVKGRSTNAFTRPW